MDQKLTESQHLLAESARDFLASRPLEETSAALAADDFTPLETLWGRMRELGWLAAPFDETVGGFAGSPFDGVLLLEQLGYAGVPTPYVHSPFAVGLARRSLAAELASGSRCIIVCEPGQPAPWLNLATDALTVDGPAARVVPLTDVTFSPLATAGAEPLFSFQAASGDSQVDAGEIMTFGAIGSSATMLGAGSRAFELALDYAKVRVQFGKPIGSFQAIQHRLAEIYIRLEASRNLVYRAATLADADQRRGAHVAKAYLNEAAMFACREAVQVHGGVGFVGGHVVQVPFRMVLSHASQFGSTAFHRRALLKSVA